MLLSGPPSVLISFLPLERVTAMATRQVATITTDPPMISLSLKLEFVRISYKNRFVHAPLHRLLLLPWLLEGDGNVSANASRSMSSKVAEPGETG